MDEFGFMVEKIEGDRLLPPFLPDFSWTWNKLRNGYKWHATHIEFIIRDQKVGFDT